MSKFKGTPGKWVIAEVVTPGLVKIQDSVGITVATIGILEQDDPCAEIILSDARLIKAAPKLLAALEAADDYLKGNKKNYIGNGSILHTNFKNAIKEALQK